MPQGEQLSLSQRLSTRAASHASTKTRHRYLGSKVRRAATVFAQLITRPLRRFPLLVAPLYPMLKLFTLVALVPLGLNLLSTYITTTPENFTLPLLKPVTEFIAARRSPMLLAMGGILVLFF